MVKDIITTTIDHYADAYNFAYNRGGIVLEEVVNFVSLYDWDYEDDDRREVQV